MKELGTEHKMKSRTALLTALALASCADFPSREDATTLRGDELCVEIPVKLHWADRGKSVTWELRREGSGLTGWLEVNGERYGLENWREPVPVSAASNSWVLDAMGDAEEPVYYLVLIGNSEMIHKALVSTHEETAKSALGHDLGYYSTGETWQFFDRGGQRDGESPVVDVSQAEEWSVQVDCL